ncbi:MAG: aminotransferase class I/II-fold pyridoxal phosphate-dependent enzyme [Spirochaetia bacterium]|nr:aminotransferase class I/II-fold pyridoxal phosphate-dependent enzyme [Spirochaetia bacterium]
MVDFKLADRMAKIDTSEIRRAFDLAAKLKNPINLSIGQPHYPMPEPIAEAIAKAVRDGKNAYTTTQGILPLRERIARKFKEENGFTAEPENILVSSGVSSLLYLLFSVLINPGDRILLTDPCFLIYKSLVDLFGAKLETIPEDFDVSQTESIPTAGLKLILYASPSNPSGYVMKKEQIRALGALADKSGALLVSDEIYELFDYDKAFQSAALVYPGTMTMMGFSKTYSMTGLRLAAATGPKDIIKAMTTLQQYTVVCAPSAVQWGGLAALDVDMAARVREYKENRDYMTDRLKGKLKFRMPQGAFYIFAELPEEDRSFIDRAIKEKELLLVPGRIFSASTRHIRISFAASKDTLVRGSDALLQLLS